ncbi:MAG: helix-turn-helix transcriptional regulator [Opitutaceae bacterium]|nr:helix-turn-helix transcriptional regulator [Opitutaceae bacterium]
MDKHDERLLWLGDTHIDEATLNRVFGRVLARLRGSDDFSPTRTAQHSGLDRAFLYAVERGEKGISLFTLFRIASASKLSASDIIRRLEQELTTQTEDVL